MLLSICIANLPIQREAIIPIYLTSARIKLPEDFLLKSPWYILTTDHRPPNQKKKLKSEASWPNPMIEPQSQIYASGKLAWNPKIGGLEDDLEFQLGDV